MMKNYKIIIQKNGIELASKVVEAKTFLERLKGLMFDKEMAEFDGLLIKACNSIHTCFMNFNLDVIFLDKDFRVVKIIKNLKPWRVTRFYITATQVLEMKGGSLVFDLQKGDKLEVLCLN